jgi:pheromone shutdown protein TraB
VAALRIYESCVAELSYAFHQIKLSAMLLWTGLSSLDVEAFKADMEAMKETDAVTEAIKECGKSFPSLLPPLLEERDAYMVWMLRGLAGKAKRVVAVVGAGHLPGIRARWDEDMDVAALVEVPPKRDRRLRRSVTIAAGVVVAAVVVVRVRGRWLR